MRKAVVYWIKSKEHTDFLTQGYVGVTTNLEQRMKSHKKQKKYLWRRFDICIEVLLVGGEEFCYEIENKIRPTERIGWNKNAGGLKPPSRRGKKASQETKDKNLLRKKETLQRRKEKLVERRKNLLSKQERSVINRKITIQRIEEGRHNFDSQNAIRRENSKRKRGWNHPGRSKQIRVFEFNGQKIVYDPIIGISFTKWCKEMKFDQSRMSSVWSGKAQNYNGITKFDAQ